MNDMKHVDHAGADSVENEIVTDRSFANASLLIPLCQRVAQRHYREQFAFSLKPIDQNVSSGRIVLRNVLADLHEARHGLDRDDNLHG